MPLHAHISQVDEEIVGQLAGLPGEDTMLRATIVGTQHAQAANQDGHLRRTQGEQLCLVHKHFFSRDGEDRLLVIAEAVSFGFENGKRVNIGLFLRSVHTTRGEGNFHFIACCLCR